MGLIVAVTCLSLGFNVNAAPPLAIQPDIAPVLTRAGASLGALPVTVTSTFDGDSIKGNASGEFEAPYSTVSDALRQPISWCDILVLHLNVKACTYVDDPGRRSLRLYVGPKEFQTTDRASQIEYAFRVEEDLADRLVMRLSAPKGPMGTRNYEIVLRASPLNATRTFVSLIYQYTLGTRGKLALKGYLRTRGRAKIGFTVLGTDRHGELQYVSGVRGMGERNVVRYYLAIKAYLECVTGEPAECENIEAIASRWFDMTERFPLQLFELSRADYLRNKTQELRQQRELQSKGS